MNSIIQIVLVFAAIVILVGLHFVRGRSKTVLLWAGIVIALMVGFRILGSLSTQNKYESFRTLTMENVAQGDQLALQNQALFNVTKNALVTYEDFAFETYRFVYLASVGRFYVAVLSVDETRSYADGRFYQADMERLDGIDTLVFLDCEHGTVFALDEHELIGRSLDLFSMQASDDAVAYKVYHPYSEKTFAYYASFFLVSERSAILYTGSPTLSPSVYFFPIVGGENQSVFDWVDSFLLGSNSEILIVAGTEVKAVRMTVDVEIDDGLIHSLSYDIDELTIHGGSNYLLQGYCMKYNGTIYYVDDLLRLRSIGSTLVHEDNVDLATWTQSIPVS
jgi:hypothetical protein